MNKEKIKKIESIIKVLEKAVWPNITIAEQIINARIIDDFAKTVTELKKELELVESDKK